MRTLAAAFVMALATRAAAGPLMDLEATIPMPGVKGRIDHLAVDVKRHRLFVAALGNDTVEVLDTENGAHATIRGLGEPQGVLYLPETNRICIANGGAGRVDLVDAASLAAVKRVGGLADADNLRYDEPRRKVLVGYGSGGLRILDPASGESEGDIALPGHPESFALEERSDRAFVNVPSAGSVVVVDRVKRRVLAAWKTPGASGNFPMALDEGARRLFVGTRSPPSLLVYDIDGGSVVARLPLCQDADDLFVDAASGRIYAICGEGRIDIIRREGADRYSLAGSVATAPRARTGLYVPEEGRIYVAAPASGGSPARVLAFRLH